MTTPVLGSLDCAGYRKVRGGVGDPVSWLSLGTTACKLWLIDRVAFHPNVEADADLGSVLDSPARVRARLAWTREFEITGQTLAWFPSLSGSAFPVVGASLPRDLGLVRLVSDFALDDRWSFRLQGDGAFADNYAGFSETLRLSARW